MLSICNKQPLQLTAGNAGECNTLIVNFECGSQENGNAPGSGRLATALRVPAACFRFYHLLQAVSVSEKRLPYSCPDRPGQSSKLWQQAGSTSPTSRVRGAIHVYPNEQIGYSDFTAFHSHLLGTVVLFSMERLSTQAFSYSKFDLKLKKYPERRFLINAKSVFQNLSSSSGGQGLIHVVAKVPHQPHVFHQPDSVHVIRGLSPL